MDKPNFKKLMRLSIQALTNFPFIEEDFDALTNYELLCKVVEELNKVSDNQKTLDNNITLLVEAFNELKNYVDNYFENLDVQEEINNKLDEMAESGQLTDIIAQYLGLAGLITFDSVSDMKQAQNLVNGSKCKTFGYYSANDGGEACYRIRQVTNDDVIDDMFIIDLYDNLLVAELIIENEIKAEQVGLKNDDSLNQSVKLQKLINKAVSIKKNIILGAGTFCFSGTITIPETQYGITIKGNGGYSTKLKALSNDSQLYFTNFLRWKLNDLFFIGTGEETESLININGISNLSEINNCIFSTNKGLLINESAYLILNHCSFNNITGHITNYLLSAKGEYLYLNNCYFEGQSNSEIGSKAVIIRGGNNYYIDKCDFCNWNNGQALVVDSSNKSVKDLYVENSTFVRNDISVEMYCDKGISNFVLNNNTFMLLTGNENKIINNERRSGTTGTTEYISGKNFIDGSTIDLSKQMFTSGGLLSKCLLQFSSTVGIPDYDDNFRLKFYSSFPNNMTIQSGDQSSKTITILSRSPYKAFNLPNLVPIKYNGLLWTSYTISNTYQGELSITFNFAGVQAYTQAYLKVEDI